MYIKKRRNDFCWFHFLPAVGLLLLTAFPFVSDSAEKPNKPIKSATSPSLRNGFYAVLRDSLTEEGAQSENPHASVLLYDKKYADADPGKPVRYVAIDTSSFVPLILEGAPDARKDVGGKTLLSVTIKEEYVKTVEEFSRAHLGGEVAILLDGEIVTIHKVRSVITGGKIQITRCSDNACEVLRAKLAK